MLTSTVLSEIPLYCKFFSFLSIILFMKSVSNAFVTVKFRFFCGLIILVFFFFDVQ